MIGTSHRFKNIVGVIFEEVLHIETLRGGGDAAISTVPGHHAGSERRGRHCTPAPDIVTKVVRAAVAGICCHASHDGDCAKIPLESCR